MKTPLTVLKTKIPKLPVSVLGAMALLGFACSASAALIAYEGFDYTVGSVALGRSGIITDWNGGTGWAGPWEDIPPDGNDPFVNPASSTQDAASDILAGSLSYTDMFGHMLVTSGNMLHNSGTNNNATSRPARNLNSIIITNGTTTWISCLGQRTGQASPTGTYDRGANLTFFNTNVWGLPGNNAGRFAIGESSGTAVGQTNDTWGFIPLGQGTQRRQSQVPFTNVALIVIRIDHHDDNDGLTISNSVDFDDLYMWVNPTNLAAEPPLTSVFTNYLAGDTNSVLGGLDFAFNRVVLFAGNLSGVNPAAEWLIDELRVGTTYADVVPFTGPILPRWTLITPSGGGVSLTLTGAPNAQFNVEVSTSLSSPGWNSLGTINLDGSGVGTITDPGTVLTNQQRFYRAKR